MESCFKLPLPLRLARAMESRVVNPDTVSERQDFSFHRMVLPSGRAGRSCVALILCPPDCSDLVQLKKRGIIHSFRPILKPDPYSKIRNNVNICGYSEDLYLRFGEGCDFEHWQIHTKPLPGSPPRHVIIAYYLQILAQVLGSEEEAVKKIYSVATRHNYGFGVNISDDLVTKLMVLPNVVHVEPDTYVDLKAKRYPWDPFINGQALPYDSRNYPYGPYLSMSDEEIIQSRAPKTDPDPNRYGVLING